MIIYNTLGRKLEELKPTRSGEIKFYSCGPTVYDHLQIGNLRTFVFYDTLRRYLEETNFKVTHVMNITDVGHLTSDADDGEDKLEKGAHREGKTVWQVAEHYIESFLSDIAELNIKQPKLARATDFIEAQVAMVGELLKKGYAYQTKQAIYFDVAKPADYGKLSGQKLADKETAVRPEVHTDSDKRSPHDFAVWFFAVGRYENHEMRWDSPWGQGFPGWHLECSAIVHALLGEPVDIHAGGVDLIGTHHENEIAQTKAAYDKKLATYWIHAEHLLVNGDKMSKSSGNFYTLQDIKKRGFDPLALRLLFLQSSYRSQLNFTWESLEAAQSFLKSLRAMAVLRYQSSSELVQTLPAQSKDKLLECLSNDLDTASALAEVAAFSSAVLENGINEEAVKPLVDYLATLDNLFGLGISQLPDISQVQKDMIAQREKARQAKNWRESDSLREKLAQQGIELNDTKRGAIWLYSR